MTGIAFWTQALALNPSVPDKVLQQCPSHTQASTDTLNSAQPGVLYFLLAYSCHS